MLKIRVSMLPIWFDCARRASAKQYYKMICSSGYSLRELPNSIGSAIGTGVHKAANIIMLGCFSRFIPLNENSWLESIKRNVPKRAQDVNLRAFFAGKNLFN